MMKTLPLEQQIVLMLKNIYGFKVEEIKIIVNKSEASVKNLLHQARKTLTEIFESRCSMVSQKGICYQCSELNGILNPKQSAQEELIKLKMVQEARKIRRNPYTTVKTLLQFYYISGGSFLSPIRSH